jgi:DNA (cytosine-5)-methyltransferase 1
MEKLRLLSLFAGIGGFELGLERSGAFETVAQCEIDPFCRRVLAKHWPQVKRYEDVRELTAARLTADGIAVDAICGGFPCQDLSVAGKRAGIEGARSGLWSEFARLIGEIRPRVVFVENVTGLLSGPSEQPGGWFGRVFGDLASIGYDAEWHCIPAGNIGAPHERDRSWIIAYTYQARLQKRPIFARMAGMETGAAWRQDASVCSGWPAEPNVLRVADGVPNRVDRIGALGNAVVPQIPELLGRAYAQAMGMRP